MNLTDQGDNLMLSLYVNFSKISELSMYTSVDDFQAHPLIGTHGATFTDGNGIVHVDFNMIELFRALRQYRSCNICIGQPWPHQWDNLTTTHGTDWRPHTGRLTGCPFCVSVKGQTRKVTGTALTGLNLNGSSVCDHNTCYVVSNNTCYYVCPTYVMLCVTIM